MHKRSYYPSSQLHGGIRLTFIAATLLLAPFARASHQYDHLILQAREGQTAPAINWFQHQPSLSTEQIADWLQITLWSGDDLAVIAIYKKYQHLKIPARGIAATTLALRNTQQWDSSIILWQTLLHNQFRNSDYQRAYIMTLADAGKYHQAITLANTMTETEPVAENYQALAYVYQRADQPENELLALTLMRMAMPQKAIMPADRMSVMQRNRLALQATRNPPHPPSDQIRADAAAEWVRLSFYPSRSEAERYRLADTALAACDALLHEWQDTPETTPYHRVQIDRLNSCAE